MKNDTASLGQIPAPALIALIAVISAAPPIATDLFLPAIPDMPAYFGTSEATVNLVLVAFFFFMAVGMLLFGPLSDKYGRKPLLLVSLGLFIACSFACAFVSSIWVLIGLRIVQGLGGGGMVSLGTALVKDCFQGEKMQKVLVITMAIGVIAPMGAPVLGAFILSFTTWQGTFTAQAIIGLLALPFALLLKEPLPQEKRLSQGVFQALGRLVVVGRNARFTLLLILCAVFAAPYMTYVSSASYIYTVQFDLSKIDYSLFFAANALLSAVGAVLVMVTHNRIGAKLAIPLCFGLGLLSGVAVLTVGGTGPVAFLVSYGVFTLATGYLRPISTAVLLEQQAEDTGSASSLINTFNTVLGSLGMMAATLPWSGYCFGLGVCISGAAIFALAGYVLMARSRFRISTL